MLGSHSRGSASFSPRYDRTLAVTPSPEPRRMLKSLAAVLAAIQLGVALPAVAQPLSPPAAASIPFDAAARGAAVEAAAKALRDRYVYPEVGDRAAAKIEANLAAGAYDGLADRVAFAERLTNDLAEIAHDKHM